MEMIDLVCCQFELFDTITLGLAKSRIYNQMYL